MPNFFNNLRIASQIKKLAVKYNLVDGETTPLSITKQDVEGVLIGEISTHSHASSGGLTQEQTEGII